MPPVGVLLQKFKSNQLTRNALFSLGQSVFVSVCLFLIYRKLITEVGAERFGVWSLLMAASTVARVGDFSGGNSLSRFVALAEREERGDPPRDLVHTVTLTSLALNILIGALLWGATLFLLPSFIDTSHLAEARSLLPWMFLQIVIGSLAGAVTSAIDGAQRADQRSKVVMAAAVCSLAATWLLAPFYGVRGFAAAQVMQQLAIVMLGWLVLRQHIPGLGWVPHRWSRIVFVETTGYSLRLNANGLAIMLFEPVVKFAINHAGGLSDVALYELSSRLISQIRALVVSAATPLVPALAAQLYDGDGAFGRLVEKATRIASLGAIGVAVGSLIAAAPVSFIVLGKVSPSFLQMSALLSLGWSLQTPSLGFYFAGQAAGVIRWNFFSHVFLAATVLTGALFIAPLYGSISLIFCICFGLVGATIVIVAGNSSALRLGGTARRLRSWFVLASGSVVFICFVFILIVDRLSWALA